MINPYAAMYDAVMTVWRWRDVQIGGYDKQELYAVEEPSMSSVMTPVISMIF